jgi:glucose/mannose-6-phosphate isomerase
MNLDNPTSFLVLDPQKMLSFIDGLPRQLQTAWELGMNSTLPPWTGIHQVLVAGMGGSAIGADLLAAYITPNCLTPFFIHRDYDLPAWAGGPETLVIASSHSGNTEETLSAFETALARNCRCLAITTGGTLAQEAQQAKIPLWKFEHRGQPRSAVGYSFGLLLAALLQMNMIPDPSNEISRAIHAMQEQQKNIQADVPVTQNPAKQIALKLIGHWVSVFGAGILAPVSRRWKGQISEIAKAWAQFEFLPEANHNTLAGIINPKNLHPDFIAIFLRCSSDHPRNQLRGDLTRKVFTSEGLNSEVIDAQGEIPLAQLWTCLHLGDYVSYYLAMTYGVDPTPVSAIESFKREMVAGG